MARRIITGVLTYSSQTNRDAALTRISTALAGLSYSNYATGVGNGVTTSGTTQIIVSIEVADSDLGVDVSKTIYDAAVQTNRQSSGFLSVNRI